MTAAEKNKREAIARRFHNLPEFGVIAPAGAVRGADNGWE
jgi:hypothetical protein